MANGAISQAATAVLLVVMTLTGGVVAAGDWITYVDETADRLLADPALGASDAEEKDYAFGDVDQDGDIDLICVRKQPWMQTGRRRNVLFLNEGVAEGHAVDGVLVDRTDDYVTAADDGGQGFLDLTADRDSQLVDVDGDGWLDLVTSATFGQGQPKTISHPRVYRNLGTSGGSWQGFFYEEDRTPTLPVTPKFCGLGFGDVSGDGAPDLYFIDYENNLEDRLWINDGTGFFADESEARMSFEMRESEFGVFAMTVDMNGDGLRDVIKCRSNGAPYRISIAYNDPSNEGSFEDFDVPYTGAPYYVDVDDLNNDGLNDVVINDDGIDRYLLNQGNGADGLADFSLFAFPSASDGFSGRTISEDLDNDGFVDVLVCDATVNGFGCDRHLDIWRNAGDPPAVTFVEEDAGIPIADRTGTWDVAVFDLNGDGWKDLVIGTCDGTSIWLAQPPADIDFVYPAGQPEIVAPDAPHELLVDLLVTGVGGVDPDSVELHVSVDGGAPVTTALVALGGDSYAALLPASACLSRLDYHVSAALETGAVFVDPPGAPAERYRTVAAAGAVTLLDDGFEDGAPGWTVINGSVSAGAWEVAAPNGTLWNGALAAPDADAGDGADVMAFVTENGPPGAAAGAHDLDGGPTLLFSPVLDLSGGDAVISFDRWLFSEVGTADSLVVSLSNDAGGSWIEIAVVDGSGSSWQRQSFVVGEHLPATAEVQVLFQVSDFPNDSITEAGLDSFRVALLVCGPTFARGDCNDDGAFGLSDAVILLDLLFGSGNPVACDDACDANDDGSLGLADAIGLLAALFQGGAPPAPPFPGCGPDPTADTLGCGAAAACL